MGEIYGTVKSSNFFTERYEAILLWFKLSSGFLLILCTSPFIFEQSRFGFPTRSDTARSVLSQKNARSLKLWIWHYPCSENKGADQLCNYYTDDLRLCFRICRLMVFSDAAAHLVEASRIATLLGAILTLKSRLFDRVSTIYFWIKIRKKMYTFYTSVFLYKSGV